MCPDVYSFIVNHKQGLDHLFGRIISYSISLPNMLIFLHVLRNLFIVPHKPICRYWCGMPYDLVLLFSHSIANQ